MSKQYSTEFDLALAARKAAVRKINRRLRAAGLTPDEIRRRQEALAAPPVDRIAAMNAAAKQYFDRVRVETAAAVSAKVPDLASRWGAKVTRAA